MHKAKIRKSALHQVRENRPLYATISGDISY